MQTASYVMQDEKFDWTYPFSTTFFKDALEGLKQFLATEIRLKVMKNAFYLTVKALSVLKIFKLLPCLFGHVEKQAD